MPPAELPAAPSPADTQRMAPIVVQAPADPNHIPQWAVKGLIAIMALIIIPGTIAVVSYVFGGIHSRLSENEKAIQDQSKEDVRIETRLQLVEGANRKQWELMSENKENIAGHSH